MTLSCPLCQPGNETVLWRDDRCRVILVDDPDYPGFCRVIWNAHVPELSDLTEAERAHLLSVVCVVEKILREALRPEKMNLASFGNLVPHLHWHVIPRFSDDAHYPDSIWASRKRDSRRHARSIPTLATELTQQLGERLKRG